MEEQYKKEIESLKDGHDWPMRQRIEHEICEVFKKSTDGEIGWGDFIGETRAVLDRMESLCKKYWPEYEE